MDGLVFEQVSHRPPPPLDRYVEKCVGYRMAGYEPGVHAGLPSRWLTFVIALDEPLDLSVLPDPRLPATRFDSAIGGLHTSPVTIRHQGDQHGVQLSVTPLGARALFGRPASDLASIVVELEDLLGADGCELIDRVRAGSTWTERFAAVESILGRRVAFDAAVRPEIGYAWRQLQASGGAVSIQDLARDTGWSRRHLTAQFRAEYGLGPKAMARVLRFERSRDRLTTAKPADRSLAAIAADCGYADQAHLSREWRALAGASPTAWLAQEELPFVQDEPVPVGTR